MLCGGYGRPCLRGVAMLSRQEKRTLAILIVLAVALACVWGALSLINGAMRQRAIDSQEQSYRELQAQNFHSVTRTVGLGEAVELTAEPTKTVALWDEGTKRFTVERIACYPTLAEAEANEELGNIFQPVPAADINPDKLWQYLVVEVTIENVDVPCPEDEDTDAAWTLIDGEVAPVAKFQYASFSGSPLGASSKRVNTYHLLPGEQATFVIGYWVDAGLAPEDVIVGIGNPYTEYGPPITVSI